MPTADPRVAKLVAELQKGGDISAKLAELWPPPPAKQALSLADSLKLANSVVKVADAGKKSPASTRAYYAAIKEMRILAKHLKKPKSGHPMAPIANVEKYCVNYALRASEEELLDASLPLAASDVAEETLRLLFQARNGTTKKPSKGRAKSSKENIDPRSSLNLDHLFAGASKMASSIDEFFPRDENAVITSVVLGAISVRITARNDSLPINCRLELARTLGEVWGKHLKQFGKEDPKHAHRMTANVNRIKNGLLTAANMPGTNLATAAQIKAYAVGLSKPQFTEYAYNILRVVNSFIRPPKDTKKKAASEKDNYEIVSGIYRDTITLIAQTTIAAVDWLHEDVSTLIDNIIEVEGRCTDLGIDSDVSIPKDALAAALQNRRSVMKGTKSMSIDPDGDKFVHLLQQELVAKKSYELLFMGDADVTFEMVHLAVKETSFPSYLSDIEKLFASHSLTSKMGKKQTMSAKTALRLLRVLEPFRNGICQNSTTLTKGQSTVLQLYVCATVLGLQSTKATSDKVPKERLTPQSIMERVGWMSSNALNAALALLKSYLLEGDAKRIEMALFQINGLVEKKPYGSENWDHWVFSQVLNTCLNLFKKQSGGTGSSPSKNGAFKIMGNTLVASTKWLNAQNVCPMIGTQLKKSKEMPTYLSTIVLATKCFISYGDNEQAIKTAAHYLLRSFCFEPSALDLEGCIGPKNRGSFLETVAKVLRLVQGISEKEESAFPDFIHLIADGNPLPGATKNAVGRNFVAALSEYSILQRRTYGVEDFTASRYIRSCVKSRYQLLKSLKLTGKCMNLQVHMEWNQLLLEEISVAKYGFKTESAKKDNILSLSDITAETPRAGWSESTVEFDNGECIDVELTPRLCRCQVCAGDGFALLHILRDSWRLAVQKQPPLLREHLGRLHRFMSACDLASIDKTLVILCLEFLEWCQVLSILSSIDDQMGVMASIIQKLKKHLDISSKYDVGSIYASHGFLASRPYYASLIDNEKSDDARVSFFENTEFMNTGCRADVFLKNLALEKAYQYSKKSLELLLARLQKHDDKKNKSRTECSVGGINFSVHEMITSPLDKMRALETLELIYALERMGTVSLKIENFNDAEYYFQKASLVSKHLCGIESLLYLRQNNVLFRNNSLVAKPSNEVDMFLQSVLNEIAVRKDGKFDRTIVSNSYTVVADVALAAIAANDKEEKRLKELGNFAAKFSRLALDSLSERYDGDRDLDSDMSNAVDVEQVNAIMHSDLSLRSGEAELLLGNVTRAIDLFEKVRDNTKEVQADSYLCALLGLASSLIYKLGGAEKAHGILKNAQVKAKGRKTRKLKEEQAAAEQIAQTLREAEELLGDSDWEPHRRMEFFMLHALVFGPMDTNRGLAWEIGNGFTLQWDMRNKKLEKRKSKKKNDEDQLVELVKEVSISSRSKDRSKEMDEKNRKLLAETNIVVVGISLDSSNGHLMLWRYSGSGFFTVKLDIPTEGKASYDSVMKRFSVTFNGMKSNAIAVKTADTWSEELKENWWKKTFQLDEEVEKILADIEEQWFAGSTQLLLLPATSDVTRSSEKENAAKQAALALANIQAVYGDQAPEDSLVEAFENLNLETKESLWDVWSDDAAIKSEKGNMVFVLDSKLEHIPFESLPILRNNKVGCTRVPSLSYLIHQIETHKYPHKPISRCVYYLLNPGGDLSRTEEKFRSDWESRKGWKGIAGSDSLNSAKNKSGGKALKTAANKADIFLFCGHGTGEKYIAPDDFKSKTENKAPVVVLMGCSSAKLKNYGGYRGNTGTPLDYLMVGAPAVVGNLWDVTDKDIDRLTSAFLETWLGGGGNGTSGTPSTRRSSRHVSVSKSKSTKKKTTRKLPIADALAEARYACKLPHLVGAATVVYGLPFL